MLSRNTVLVSICCLTYNHKAFIRKAIDSFLNQKTKFKFEIVIGEDCSTDGTHEIVLDYFNKYGDLIRVMTSESNVGAINNELRTISACKGKYIAYCEGDDYWTDPYKLQKQVDFLEAHPDYGLVHSDINVLNQETGDVTSAYNKTNHIQIPSGNIYDFLMRPGHFIKTMTVCLRKELLDTYYLSNQQIIRQDWRLIDISLWLMIAQHSKIHYMDEVMATYRLLPESMSRSQSPEKLFAFHQKIRAIRFFFLRKYGTLEENRKLIFKNYYTGLFSDGYNLKNKKIFCHGKAGLKKWGYKLTFKQKVMSLLLSFSGTTQ